METTAFYEQEYVEYLGDGLDGLPPARARIMSFASKTAANVVWLDGPRTGQIDMVSLYDLEKTASPAVVAAPTVSAPVLARRVMHREGSAGLLQYLAATHQLDSWDEIAAETLRFVESRLRVHSSLDVAYETLSPDEMDDVVKTGARALLRDKFSGVE